MSGMALANGDVFEMSHTFRPLRFLKLKLSVTKLFDGYEA